MPLDSDKMCPYSGNAIQTSGRVREQHSVELEDNDETYLDVKAIVLRGGNDGLGFSFGQRISRRVLPTKLGLDIKGRELFTLWLRLRLGLVVRVRHGTQGCDIVAVKLLDRTEWRRRRC